MQFEHFITKGAIVMSAEKVVMLHQNQVYDQIQKFLNIKGLKSENTKINYTKHIKDFFNIIRPDVKDIRFLKEEDVQITLDDFEDFILTLKDEGNYKNNTINTKVRAVKSLIKYLFSKNIIKDIGFIQAGQVENLPEIVDSYGVLTVDEVLKMADLAYEERELGEIKYYLILFALDTCLRQRAILRLKWSDFEIREDCVVVHAVDKGNKKFNSKISKEFYNELLKLKKYNKPEVFPISSDSINDMMKRLRNKMNIADERNIVFHSIRKAGVTFQYRITGDILQAKKAANHSNIHTTTRYIGETDYGVIGAVSAGNRMDENLYKNVSYEELLKAIENCPKDVQLIINIKLKEIVDKI